MSNTSIPAAAHRLAVQLDDLDRRLLRCLQLAPRAPFRSFAEVLGVSEQTVARRYRRLREAGIVRVTAVVNAEAHGETTWLIRLTCAPRRARELARAVARCSDTGWVFLAGAGNEVIFAERSRSAAARAELLLDRLSASTGVLALSGAMTLHEFPSGPDSGGYDLGVTLGAREEARLIENTPSRSRTTTSRPRRLTGDQALIRCLERDGRASYAQLVAAADLTPNTATRNTHSLIEQGVISIRVDVAPRVIGRPVEAQLWMSAPPTELDRCGHTLAGLPGVTFAAAVAGTANLVASVACADHQGLYRFVTSELAAVPDLAVVDVVPAVVMLKQAASVVERQVLAA